MRTLNQIYQEIITFKEAQAQLEELQPTTGETFSRLLSDLSSTSKVAIWRLWAYIVAFYIWQFEKLNAIYMQEAEAWASRKQVPTLRWYRQQALNYLHGVSITWDEATQSFLQLPDPDDDINELKVVKYCATIKAPGRVRIKVAADDNGTPAQLTTSQKSGLEFYLNQVRAAGDDLEIVNNEADKLKISFDVYVDPLAIDISTGELINEPGTNPVEDALSGFLLNLPFNGRLKSSALIDAIQSATGVTDIELLILEYKYGAFPWQPVGVSVVPDAGYFEVEELTINYLPSQV